MSDLVQGTLDLLLTVAKGPLAGGIRSADFADSAASASLAWIRLVSPFCHSGVTNV
jgi:hypothetical protein